MWANLSKSHGEIAKFRPENSLEATALGWAGVGLREFCLYGCLFLCIVRNADPGRRVAGRHAATSRGRPRIPGRSRHAATPHCRSVDRGRKEESGGGTRGRARGGGASGEGKRSPGVPPAAATTPQLNSLLRAPDPVLKAPPSPYPPRLWGRAGQGVQPGGSLGVAG